MSEARSFDNQSNSTFEEAVVVPMDLRSLSFILGGSNKQPGGLIVPAPYVVLDHNGLRMHLADVIAAAGHTTVPGVGLGPLAGFTSHFFELGGGGHLIDPTETFKMPKVGK
jgi:hypothetical protein